MLKFSCLTTSLLLTALMANAQGGNPKDTELWTPVPKVVAMSSESQIAPADAIILFNGKNLDEWETVKDKSAAKWIVSGDMFTVKKGTGNIQTKRTFNNYQLHLEWRIPTNITGEGQGRGNSGVFVASTGTGDGGYELQVLDSYNNATYSNGQAGSIYKQFIPLVNASKKPGEWQSYDIIWTAPIFNDNGSLKTPARITVLHNGVLIQNNTEIKGETVYIGAPKYKKHGPTPIKLQDHGDPSPAISFRNIWVREL
ncbi:MAG: DUF1080 domain-containing protein [Daejeonella sp.]|uniref:3-keto-disaccharide hydrolase n=1 Tax=Daejeonella sp. TaxID=2805397 RepID=UPI003C7375A0